jgi:hypothetical protein
MVENERKDDKTGDSGGKSPKKLRVLLRTFGCPLVQVVCEIIAVILKKVSGCDKKGQGGRYNSSKYLSPEMTEIKWDDRINNLFILGLVLISFLSVIPYE